jgi:hypothetical protein
VHSKHGGPEPHPCPEPGCSNLPSFASASALSRHIRDVHSKRGGPKEILRCPIDECKRHFDKAFSRMDGLVKHLAAIHCIKKSSAEVRRDYSFPTESPNRHGPRESVGGHENASPGPRLQEDIAPHGQFMDKKVELEVEQRQLEMRDLHLVEERRSLNVRLEQQGIDRRERQNLRDEVVRLALREQKNKARMLAVQQELDSVWPQFATSFPLFDRFDSHEQRDHDMRSIWEDVEPRGDTMNAEDATAVLRRHQAQLTTLEQQHEMRVSTTQQEQDRTPPQPAIPSPSPDQLEPLPVPDYRMQLMLLEQKNKKRLLMARQEQNVLEQQDKERLLKARQEQDHSPSHAVAYDQHAVPTTMYTPTLDDLTMFTWTGYSTAEDLEPPSPSRWADVPSYQTLPGLTYPEPDLNYEQMFPERPDPGFAYPQVIPQGFAKPNFRAPYSPTGSDNADAGSITSAPALKIGTSRSGQAAGQQLPSYHELQPDHRPFRCDECPASFNRNHDLKRHKRIHLAVKPFPCGFCDKSFSRKEALKVRCNQISPI